MNTKQVIVLRKDLNMRKGKMVAQGAHASMKAILDRGFKAADADGLFCINMTPEMEAWICGIFTKVCVGVSSEQELLAIYEVAKSAGLPCSLIQDAGRTEFGGVPTYTAVAVGPDEVEKVNAITGSLPLL